MEEMSEIYRHAKTGGLYVVIADAELEANMTTVVVYKSLADGRAWVRPASEFYDPERFVQVPRRLLKTWA
jgi:hypothetical protein